MFILFDKILSLLIPFYLKLRNSHYFKLYDLDILDVKVGQEWKHIGNGHIYIIIDINNLNIFGCWVSENIISYKDTNTGIVYSRLIFDFLKSFERI